MSGKHTPGPWRTHVVDSTMVIGSDGSEIAQTLGDYESLYATMEADANLIAAAPDLLEALEAFIDVVENSGGVHGLRTDGRASTWGDRELDFINDAVAALRKARGKS